MKDLLSEVNVSNTPMYRVVSDDLLRTLMKRTGTGRKVTVRELAHLARVPSGTIGALTAGTQRLLPRDKAERIARAIGVDVLVLFIPCERAGRAYIDAAEAVSA